MTYILIILKVQVRLKKKVSLFCKKNYILHYLRNAIYRCIVIFLGQCIDTLKSCIVSSLILYGGNVWQWESLAKLASHPRFASQILAYKWYPYGQNLSIR